ncbi:MAG: DUF6768 family protein [Erythrobacter sp.]
MSDIDDRIRGALDADDKAFLASLDEGRGMFSQMGDVLAGPLGGWAKLIFVFAIPIGLAVVYCGFRFFTAPGFDEAVWWGIVTLGLLTMQGFIKEWFYARMNLLSMLRELKRLQVQVAMLAEDRS